MSGAADVPGDTDLLPGLGSLIPAERPTASSAGHADSAEHIVHLFFDMAERLGRSREDLLDFLGCDGRLDQESMKRSLAFLSTAEAVSDGDDPQLANAQVDFLLAAWRLIRRDPNEFHTLLQEGQPTIWDLTSSGQLGEAFRAMQRTHTYRQNVLAPDLGS